MEYFPIAAPQEFALIDRDSAALMLGSQTRSGAACWNFAQPCGVYRRAPACHPWSMHEELISIRRFSAVRIRSYCVEVDRHSLSLPVPLRRGRLKGRCGAMTLHINPLRTSCRYTDCL